MGQLVLRFLIGGLVVSFFAALGDVLKPKRFAGLFGAAPSVALATLGLAALSENRAYVATEARSMLAGSVAFLLYACIASRMMIRLEWHARNAAVTALGVWIAISFSAWFAFLR